MLRSRVAVFCIALMSCLSASAFACGDNGDGKACYQPVNARLFCFTVKGRYHDGVFVPRHRICVVRQGYYTCAKYVSEITPQHRDKYCSQWTWHHPHRYWHHHMHHEYK